MKKTVVFDFPDNFKFPEKWGLLSCTGCPFDTSMDDEPMCFLTGDGESGIARYDSKTEKFVHLPSPQCPFYGGADTINYDDC